MKLTVDTLDNDVKSAVIDIGANNGYVEVFIHKGIVHLNVFNKRGDVVHEWDETTKALRGETWENQEIDLDGGLSAINE